MDTPASTDQSCVIIGAGPAGLTAAFEASRLGFPATVLEKDSIVGGISRTVEYKGYRFDIGGHRFYTKVGEVEEIWHALLPDDLLVRPRLSRIYYRDRFFDYPIKPLNALLGLGPLEAVRIVFSYARARLFPSREERTFEQWVSNRFGRRLFEIFFRTYTEKVWGMSCSEIGSDWAVQRIQNLDLVAAVKNALLSSGSRRKGGVRSLIEQFHYPRLGPGMLWERCQELLEAKGYPTRMGVEVVRIEHDDGRVRAVIARDASGKEWSEPADQLISSMPIRELVHALDPPAPASVRAAADRLRYRDFLTVALIVDRAELFPDNWIYIHSPRVKVGRIQNFKQWSPEMVPDPQRSSLGLEYFVQEGDEVWAASDEDLIALASRECALLGLIDEDEVIDGTVIRMPKAYPVYDDAYKQALDEIRSFLDPIENLQLIGRNGQHRYNNQDHSMATALLAARNIAGATHDVWGVNVDQEYLEEASETPLPSTSTSDRLVPRMAAQTVDEEAIRAAFARYDPVALGSALGVLMGALLFIVTAVPLLRGNGESARMVALLGQYFLGYEPSWMGSLLIVAEASVVGFLFGALVASVINRVVAFHEQGFRARAEMSAMIDDPEAGGA